MKKFLILCAVMLGIGHFAQAQFGKAYTFPLVKGDTATTTDTVFKSFTTTAGYSVVGIQASIAKLTGTPAGKVLLYQSIDGVNYIETDSVSLAAPIISSATPGTSFLTGQIQKTVGTPMVYYIVAVTNTAGSSSGVATVSYTIRRNQTIIAH